MSSSFWIEHFYRNACQAAASPLPGPPLLCTIAINNSADVRLLSLAPALAASSGDPGLRWAIRMFVGERRRTPLHKADHVSLSHIDDEALLRAIASEAACNSRSLLALDGNDAYIRLAREQMAHAEFAEWLVKVVQRFHTSQHRLIA